MRRNVRKAWGGPTKRHEVLLQSVTKILCDSVREPSTARGWKIGPIQIGLGARSLAPVRALQWDTTSSASQLPIALSSGGSSANQRLGLGALAWSDRSAASRRFAASRMANSASLENTSSLAPEGAQKTSKFVVKQRTSAHETP